MNQRKAYLSVLRNNSRELMTSSNLLHSGHHSREFVSRVGCFESRGLHRFHGLERLAEIARRKHIVHLWSRHVSLGKQFR